MPDSRDDLNNVESLEALFDPTVEIPAALLLATGGCCTCCGDIGCLAAGDPSCC